MKKLEGITEDNVSPPIEMKVKLNTEHFYSVEYLIKNCVRSESTPQEEHNRLITKAHEILKRADDVFSSIHPKNTAEVIEQLKYEANLLNKMKERLEEGEQV